MKFLLYITFIFSVLGISAQNISFSEKELKEPSLINKSSYKNQISSMDDSTLNQFKNTKIAFSPNALIAYENNKLNYSGGFQILGKHEFSSKLDFYYYSNLSYTNTKLKPYYSTLQNKAFFNFNKSTITEDLRARIIYKANPFVEVSAGLDKHFLGEGDRSLLIGNQGIANPFILLKTTFWKFEYLNLQQILREGIPLHYAPKGNSTHYINFNHENKISFGIFESVVHIIKDTLYDRGYEVEYLNPLIFYRPQEYSTGSPDNVLLGVNGFITFKKTRLYGQFVLDDINIQEIKNRSKFWANKYGIQAGFKTWFNLFGTEIFLRSEINLVTPFTYASAELGTNYSNQGLTLAHPLGSSFVESYSEFAFKISTFHIHSWFQVYKKGNDYNNLSFGGDIFKSYNNRAHGDYNYFIGDGQTLYSMQLGTKIDKQLKLFKAIIFIEPRLFITKESPSIESNFFLTSGFHIDFGSPKRNY